MDEMKIVVYSGIRVLTTRQVAKAYEVTTKKISNNFNANKKRYVEGKHYICLSGEEKRQFINRPEFQDSSNRAKYLYLWTERGALLLAKSINTDTAWEAYERLVDFYFDKKEEPIQEPPLLIQNNGFPMQASLPAPLRPKWYDRNKDTICSICDHFRITHQQLYHILLKSLGGIFDITAAREIYKRDRGYYPEYAMDIVPYFPEIESTVDMWLKYIYNAIILKNKA